MKITVIDFRLGERNHKRKAGEMEDAREKKRARTDEVCFSFATLCLTISGTQSQGGDT